MDLKKLLKRKKTVDDIVGITVGDKFIHIDRNAFMEISMTRWFSEITTDKETSPSFGFTIGWNIPKRFWEPYISIDFLKTHIMIGWYW